MYSPSDTGLRELAGNVIAGVHDMGLAVVWRVACDAAPGSHAGGTDMVVGAGNEVYSAVVGVSVLPTTAGAHPAAFHACAVVRHVQAWQCSHVGIMALDHPGALHVHGARVADCHVGISLNFVHPPGVAGAGP